MKILQRTLNGEHVFANGAHSVRLLLDTGVELSIIDNHDGTVNVSEATYRHLSVQPSATNAIVLGTIEPKRAGW